MKLKTKLIPLVSAASVAAVAIPLATTSCGLTRYTDMLAEYVPGVTPYEKIVVDGYENANELYKDRTVLNPDIIRDDILYTWSQCLNTKESRDRINYLASFTTYDLDVEVDDVKDEEGVSYSRVTFYAHVAGQASHAYISEELTNITDFDLNIKCAFSNLGASTFNLQPGGITKGRYAMKDYYIISLPAFAASQVRVQVRSTGSFSYVDALGTKEVTVDDYDESALFTMVSAWYDLDNIVAFFPFIEFVASVPYLGMYFSGDADEFDPHAMTALYYGCHYFKNVTISQ